MADKTAGPGSDGAESNSGSTHADDVVSLEPEATEEEPEVPEEPAVPEEPEEPEVPEEPEEPEPAVEPEVHPALW